jgi:hypothetical protein
MFKLGQKVTVYRAIDNAEYEHYSRYIGKTGRVTLEAHPDDGDGGVYDVTFEDGDEQMFLFEEICSPEVYNSPLFKAMREDTNGK